MPRQLVSGTEVYKLLNDPVEPAGVDASSGGRRYTEAVFTNGDVVHARRRRAR